MKFLPAAPAWLLCASLAAGCNLSPAQIQQLVDQGKQIAQKLAEAGIKLQIADATGKPVTLTKADVKQVFLDGKEVPAEQFDVVNGEIKFKDLLEKNSGQKVVKVVLKNGLVIDNVKIDTSEGKPASTEAKFIAGPGGRLSAVDAGKSLAEAARDRAVEARKSGVVVKAGIKGLTNDNIFAVGVRGPNSGDDDPVFLLPRSAFSATPDGGVVFDVQFLWVLARSAEANGATEEEIKGAIWYVAHKTSAGFELNAFRLLKGLQQPDPATGHLPGMQVLHEKGTEFELLGEPQTYRTFEEMTRGVILVELDEYGRIPDDWAKHRVDDVAEYEGEKYPDYEGVEWDYDENG